LKSRYHDVADARVDIQKVLTNPDKVFMQPSTAQTTPRSRRLWVAAALAIGIVVGFAVWTLRPSVSEQPSSVSRFSYVLPEGQQFTEGRGLLVAVSANSLLKKA
jgi:hypothetical protein